MFRRILGWPPEYKKCTPERVHFSFTKYREIHLSKFFVAVCLCLLIAVLPTIIPIHEQIDEIKQLEQSEVFLYGGNYYYIIGSDDVPEWYGFPAEITDKHAGELFIFLERNVDGDLAVAAKETQIALFEYATATCDAAKILKYGDKWYPVIFAGVVSDNMEQLNGVEQLDFQKLYHIYDINDASDIMKIQIGSATTEERFYTEEAEEIETFYSATVGLQSYSREEFEQTVYSDCKTDTDREKISDVIAKDFRKLQIVTNDGLILHLQLYPSLGWLRSIEANAHFVSGEEIISWYNELVEIE